MKVIMIRKKTKGYGPQCQYCVFENACMETNALPKPFGNEVCGNGEYWIFEDVKSEDAICVLTDNGFCGIVVNTEPQELELELN